MKSYTKDAELLLHDAAPGTVVRALRGTSETLTWAPCESCLRGGTEYALCPLRCGAVGVPGRSGTQTGWGQRFRGLGPHWLMPLLHQRSPSVLPSI